MNNKNKKNKYLATVTNQQGVTLLLAILVLSSVLAISFSLSTILFIEVRNSGDLLRTEPALYAANGVGEEAIFNVKRSTCPNGCTYNPSQFNNNVTLSSQPVQTATSTPIFQDKIPAGTSFNTAKTYLLYNAAKGTSSAAGSNYGGISVKYLDTGDTTNRPLVIYLCEYDPNTKVDSTGQIAGSYNSTACSDPNDTLVGSNVSYWKVKNLYIYSTAPASYSTWMDLNQNKQQELFLYNPATSGASIFVSIETFGPGPTYTPTGLPYNTQTAVEINTVNTTVGRKIRVIIPNTSGGTSSAPLGGFAHHRVISINTGQVPSAQINFPVLVNISDAPTMASLQSAVQSPQGYDILFTKNPDGTGILNSEVESYNSSTGALVAWVNIDSTNYPSGINVGTTFYMFYGKSGVSSPPNSSSAVWNSNFKAVYHLPNGTTLTANDSTNSANGTVTGATAQTGKIGGSASFNGTASTYINLGSNTAINTATNGTAFTISSWVNPTNGTQGAIIFGNKSNDHARILALNIWGTGFCLADENFQIIGCRNSILPTVWQYVVWVYNNGTNDLYVNGVEQGLSMSYTFSGTNTSNYTFSDDFVLGLLGSIDEARISNINRSADWILTEYNNQNSPGTFYDMGAELTP